MTDSSLAIEFRRIRYVLFGIHLSVVGGIGLQGTQGGSMGTVFFLLFLGGLFTSLVAMLQPAVRAGPGPAANERS